MASLAKVTKRQKKLYLSVITLGLLGNGIYFGFFYHPAPPPPIWQSQVNGSIKALAYSAATQEVWVAASAHIVAFKLNPPRQSRELERHEQSISNLVISPDGTYAASSELDGKTQLWRVATGKVIRTLKFGDYRQGVDFAPDNTLACAGDSGALNLVNPATGKVRKLQKSALELRTELITQWKETCRKKGMKFVAPPWRSLSIPSPPPPPPTKGTYTGPPDPAGAAPPLFPVKYSPDGSSLVTGSTPISWVWDVKTGVKQRQLPAVDINDCAYSADGKLFAIGMWSGSVSVWDTATYKLLFTLDPTTMNPDPNSIASNGISFIAFTPDSKRLISGGRDCTLRLWDTQTGALLGTIAGDPEFSNGITSVMVSPDGQQVIIGEGNTLKIWPLTAFRS